MGIGNKMSGVFIIDGHAISLEPGQIVSYRDDKSVEEFQTRGTMESEHRRRYPDKYDNNEETP